MESLLNSMSVVALNSPSGKVEIFANVIESKSKTSRFMVTSLVSKMLQQ